MASLRLASAAVSARWVHQRGTSSPAARAARVSTGQPHTSHTPTAASNPTATPAVSWGSRPGSGGSRGGAGEAQADEEQTEPGHRTQGQGGHR